MNLNHLAVFDAVAREGSVSRAGERLMVSQPAVSKQVRLLEQALGTRLFDRAARGVRLTAAGELLAGYARRLFAVADEAAHAMAELQGLARGRLVVGASTTIGSYYLPAVLGAFRRAYPTIELGLEVANTHVIQQALLEYRVDVAATEGFVHWPGLLAEAFMEDQMVPIAPRGHPLTRRRPTLAEFCREPLLVREAGSGSREVLEQALHARGISVAPFMTVGNTEAIKRSVAAGVGVAFVSTLAIAPERADGAIAEVRLADFSLRRPLHIVRAQGRAPSRAAEAFVALLRRGGPTPPRGRRTRARASR